MDGCVDRTLPALMARLRGTVPATFQASFSGILPPNSAVISYGAERALLISAHLSTEIAVRAHCKMSEKVRVPRLWKQHRVETHT